MTTTEDLYSRSDHKLRESDDYQIAYQYGDQHYLSGHKRARFSTSCLSIKTVLRRQATGDIQLDHLFGCGDNASMEEKARADAIIRETGQVICTICNSTLSANKKAVRRYK